MSKTLNLADHLLARGRHFQALGREQDAVRILNRLINFKLLSRDIAEEAKARLAEILVGWGRLARARKHLTALLLQCPSSARYHYLMATALNGDERANPERAAEHYRKSLQLDPKQPKCLGEYGLLALRLNLTDEGLRCLYQAAELAPDNPDVVRRLLEGLRQLGRDDEASAVLRAARFRNSRDSRFAKLWSDYQFRCLHDEQCAARNHPGISDFEANGPRVLPFVRPEGHARRLRAGGKIIRSDAPAPLQPPHIANPDQVPGKKHA